MATRDEIKDAILKVAGDPVSGAIKDLAESMADAVHAIDNPPSSQRVEIKENRVTKPAETR
jgi:hypothetical protein